MSPQTRMSERHPTDAWRLAFGWFAAPFAWVLHLGLGYALAGWACDHGAVWVLHALTAFALLLAALGIAANRNGDAAVSGGDPDSAPPIAPVPFLHRSGRLLGALFFALIVVESVPILFAGECA